MRPLFIQRQPHGSRSFHSSSDMNQSRPHKPTRLGEDEETLHSPTSLKGGKVNPQNVGLKTRIESIPMQNIHSGTMGEDEIWVQRDLWLDTESPRGHQRV